MLPAIKVNVYGALITKVLTSEVVAKVSFDQVLTLTVVILMVKFHYVRINMPIHMPEAFNSWESTVLDFRLSSLSWKRLHGQLRITL